MSTAAILNKIQKSKSIPESYAGPVDVFLNWPTGKVLYAKADTVNQAENLAFGLLLKNGKIDIAIVPDIS